RPLRPGWCTSDGTLRLSRALVDALLDPCAHVAASVPHPIAPLLEEARTCPAHAVDLHLLGGHAEPVGDLLCAQQVVIIADACGVSGDLVCTAIKVVASAHRTKPLYAVPMGSAAIGSLWACPVKTGATRTAPASDLKPNPEAHRVATDKFLNHK